MNGKKKLYSWSQERSRFCFGYMSKQLLLKPQTSQLESQTGSK